MAARVDHFPRSVADCWISEATSTMHQSFLPRHPAIIRLRGAGISHKELAIRMTYTPQPIAECDSATAAQLAPTRASDQ